MFKDKIKRLRETHNLTQEELAKKVTVSRTAVSKWETGKGYPSLDTLKEISLLFDISIDELISDTDVGDKRRLDRQKRQESILKVIAVLLIVSLTFGWFFFKKTEVMRYTADEAMMYGFKGISHDLDCASRQLIALRGNGYLEKEDFARLCRDLERDMFYSVETIASFDYGVCEGYNDYDIFSFYCYFSDLANVSKSFETMTPEEINQVYHSLYRICTEFNRFDWSLPRTDNYYDRTDLSAYDFNRDPRNVRIHLVEMERIAEEESESISQYITYA